MTGRPRASRPVRFSRPGTWRRGRLLAPATALALAAGLVGVPLAHAAGPPSTEVRTVAAKKPTWTKIRVSSFNVLGHSHTTPGGSRAGMADGRTRMRMATWTIRKHDLDVIGLQEMQRPQWKVFRSQLGKQYRMYPSGELGNAAMHNSIAWDYTTWFAERKRTIKMPYFKGNLIKMPYVQLRNRTTGRLVWVINNHFPADTRGSAQQHRDRATKLEISLVKRLQRTSPKIPVISTGDKNERADYFCPMVRRTNMRAPNGGGIRDGKCRVPDKAPVDWVMGSRNKVRFNGYTALRTDWTAKITDHKVILASAWLPPAGALGWNPS